MKFKDDETKKRLKNCRKTVEKMRIKEKKMKKRTAMTVSAIWTVSGFFIKLWYLKRQAENTAKEKYNYEVANNKQLHSTKLAVCTLTSSNKIQIQLDCLLQLSLTSIRMILLLLLLLLVVVTAIIIVAIVILTIW